MPEPITNPNLDLEQLAEDAGVSMDEAREQQSIDPSQNPDVIVGGALMNRRPEQDFASTSNEAVGELDDIGRRIDAMSGTGTAGTDGTTTPPTLSDKAQIAFDKSFDILDTMAKATEQDRKDALENIRAQGEISKADMATSQRMQAGATSMKLASIGGYLGDTGSGIAYMNSLQSRHRLETEKLNLMIAEALEKAKIAYDQKDIDLANQLMSTATNYQNQLDNQRVLAMQEAKHALDLLKYDRMEVSEIIENTAKSGVKPPEGYLEMLDLRAGYSPGTSSGLFDVVQREEEMKRRKEEFEMETEFAKTQAEIDRIYANIRDSENKQMLDIQKFLRELPTGKSFTIEGMTYFGNFEGDKESWFEVDEVTGNAVGFIYNKTYDTWGRQELGFAGRKQDGWENKVASDGKMWRVNKFTNQMIPFEYSETAKSWDEIMPTGMVWDNYGKRTTNIGQCGAFVNDATGIGVGDSLESKEAVIDWSIGKKISGKNPYAPDSEEYGAWESGNNPVRIGDVVVQRGVKSYTWTGHVSLVSDIRYDQETDKTWYRLTESNAKGDLKMTHDRWIAEDDPMLVGFGRGELDSRLFSGSDYPTFPVPGASSSSANEINLKQFNLTPEQELNVYALVNDVFKSSRAVVNKNIVEAAAAMFAEGKTRDNIEDELRYAAAPSVTGTWRGALTNAVSRLTTAKKTDHFNELDRLLEMGDEIGAREVLKKATIDGMPSVTDSSQQTGRDNTISFLKNIEDDIKAFQKAGGNMDIFAGTEQFIMNKIGEMSDPTLQSISNKISTALFDYRKNMTGVAFTPAEAEQYKKIFPGPEKTFAYNKVLIDSLVDTFRFNYDHLMAIQMGRTNYDELFGKYGTTDWGMGEAKKAGLYGGMSGSLGSNVSGASGSTFTSSSGENYNLPY
jgi:hypothetical protein